MQKGYTHFCVLTMVMFPAPDGVHADAPGWLLKYPSAQGVHVCAPCKLKVPAGEGRHWLMLVAPDWKLKWPAGHAWQDVSLDWAVSSE